MARIDQMQSLIDVMSNTLMETTAEMNRMKDFITANSNAATNNAAAIDNLMKKSNAAWEGQGKRIEELSAELDKEVDERRCGDLGRRPPEIVEPIARTRRSIVRRGGVLCRHQGRMRRNRH